MKLEKKKDAGGQPKFLNISKLALALLSLPFSNASVERAFSMFNITKNKLRNRMCTSTAESILRVKYSLKDGCHNFTPTSEMIKLFTFNNMYTATAEDLEILDSFGDE